MIDWLTFEFHCKHEKHLFGDRILCIKSSGELDWESRKSINLKGSYDSNLTLKTSEYDSADPDRSKILVSGNPVKFFQGHNVFGTEDIHGLVHETIAYLLQRPELTLNPTENQIELLRNDDIDLIIVDINRMFKLDDSRLVKQWLMSAEKNSYMQRFGKPSPLSSDLTLRYGQGSRRQKTKFYSKYHELMSKTGKLPLNIPFYDSLHEYSKGMLRAETRLFSKKLRDLNLRKLYNWEEYTADKLIKETLEKIDMNQKMTIDDKILEQLTPALRTSYIAWVNGADLRTVLTRPTFYRYRSILMEHGINISTTNPDPMKNVVPLVRVLEAVPASIPDWAYGTPILLEPRSNPYPRKIA